MVITTTKVLIWERFIFTLKFPQIRFLCGFRLHIHLSDCDDININIETLLFRNDEYSYDVNSQMFRHVRTFINQNKQFKD
jgi:hypothetical protein